MRIKFNDQEYGYYDYEKGYIIYNLKDFNSFFIEREVFSILEKSFESFICVEDLNSTEYETDELIEFINSLIDKGIFIKDW